MQSKKFSTMNVKSQQLKLVKMKGPSKDASVLCGREKRAITSGKEGRKLGGNVDGSRGDRELDLALREG